MAGSPAPRRPIRMPTLLTFRRKRPAAKTAAACLSLLAAACFACGPASAAEHPAGQTVYHIDLQVGSTLPRGNVPFDPRLDLGQFIRDHGGRGVLDPNSIEVIDAANGRKVPFARAEDFAYGDAGRLAWVITDPARDKYEVRFTTAASRPALEPQTIAPLVGTGDLLRYNAGRPRPIELNFSSRLADLSGDGKPDLVGTWNYAYRPGDRWNGVVCYPRTGAAGGFEVGDWCGFATCSSRGRANSTTSSGLT